MAYPSPSLYLYRVAVVAPAVGTGAVLTSFSDTATNLGYFVPQVSLDSGTTYKPIFTIPFQSLIDAKQAISVLVNHESNFASAVVNSGKLPVVTYAAYP